jgi:hypothetical protein
MEGNSSSSSKATAPLPDVPTHASDAELALAGHTLQTLVPFISDWPQWGISSVLTWRRDRNSLARVASKYWWQAAYWCGRGRGNPYKLGCSLFLSLRMTPVSPMYHTSVGTCLWSTSPVNRNHTLASAAAAVYRQALRNVRDICIPGRDVWAMSACKQHTQIWGENAGNTGTARGLTRGRSPPPTVGSLRNARQCAGCRASRGSPQPRTDPPRSYAVWRTQGHSTQDFWTYLNERKTMHAHLKFQLA